MYRILSALGVLGFMLVVGLFLLRAPLTESFWLDETITAWMVQGTVGEVVERTLRYQGQSPLYFVVAHGVSLLAGSTELVLRSLSLVAFAGALIFFGLILRRQGTPWFGVLVAVATVMTHEVMAPLIVSARPYAFGLLFVMISFWGWLRWCDHRRQIVPLGIWLAATLLAFYSHYLFLLIVPVELLYAALVARINVWRERRVLIWSLLLLTLGLFPGSLQLMELAGRGQELQYARVPDRHHILQIVPIASLLVLAVSILITQVGIRASEMFHVVSNRSFLFGLLWFLSGPLFFWGLAEIGGVAMFIPRHFCWSVFGLGWMLAAIFTPHNPAAKGKEDGTLRVVGAALCCFALLGLRETKREWRLEDWRGAAGFVREQLSPAFPVVLYSGLVELRSAEFVLDRANWDYLNAPFTTYGTLQPVIPLALDVARPENQVLRQSIVAPFLGAAEKFILVSLTQRRRDHFGEEYDVRTSFHAFFDAQGFRRDTAVDFGRVVVDVFRRRDVSAGSQESDPQK